MPALNQPINSIPDPDRARLLILMDSNRVTHENGKYPHFRGLPRGAGSSFESHRLTQVTRRAWTGTPRKWGVPQTDQILVNPWGSVINPGGSFAKVLQNYVISGAVREESRV